MQLVKMLCISDAGGHYLWPKGAEVWLQPPSISAAHLLIIRSKHRIARSYRCKRSGAMNCWTENILVWSPDGESLDAKCSGFSKLSTSVFTAKVLKTHCQSKRASPSTHDSILTPRLRFGETNGNNHIFSHCSNM